MTETCEYCKYAAKGDLCSRCKNNYGNMFEPMQTNLDKFHEVFGLDPDDIFHRLYDWSIEVYEEK